MTQHTLTHGERAAYYRGMINLLESDGWIQDALVTQDGFCTIGAVHRVTQNLSSASIELQTEIGNEIVRRYPVGVYGSLRARISRMDHLGFFNGDANVIAFWNDMPGRRKKTVIRLLDRLATKHEILAAPEREAELRAQIAYLERELASHKERIAELEAEVSWWKARRAKVTVAELREEFKNLDTELDVATQELQTLAAK